MKSSLTPEDVIADIEFELMQGSISRNALGESIQTVRQFQNGLRQQTFDAERSVENLYEALSRQYQVNDMLLTLLQEMAKSNQEMQQKIDWVGQARQGKTPQPRTPHNPSGQGAGSRLALRANDDLLETMQLEAIYQKMDLQPTSRPIPVLGGLIRKFRVGLHQVALFYVNKLARRQTAVNNTHADWILYLYSLIRHQQEENEQRLVSEQQDNAKAGHS